MGRHVADGTDHSARWSPLMVLTAVVAVAAVTFSLMLPFHYADAATTSISTLYKTGQNLASGSTASSSDSPGGASTGTAAPGDRLRWVVNYQNNTSGNATVNLKDVITGAGTYVPGSLVLPPNANPEGSLAPQYSINGGATWVSGTPPSNANGVGFAGTLMPPSTTQLSQPIPPPVAQTLALTGGDAYNIAMRGNLIYAVYHHRTGAVVYCSQLNGTTCPGWPTNSNVQTWSSTAGAAIGTGASFPGYTAWQGGTWISGTKLFWMVATSDKTSVGTACLDLASAPPVSCGYQALEVNQTIDVEGSSIGSNGLGNGTYVYGVMQVNGTKFMCMNQATGAFCGVLDLLSNTTNPDAITATTFGTFTFASVRQSATSTWQTYCFDTAQGGLCAGSWPVSTNGPSSGASPFAPVLSSSGAVTGVCAIRSGIAGSIEKCVNVRGDVIASPYTGTAALYSPQAGAAFVRGTKVYVSTGNQVICRDFAGYTGGTAPACAGFTTVNNRLNYTVRDASPIAPNCLVATGDAGQITFFNAVTGGACTGIAGPQSTTVVPAQYYCASGANGWSGWGTLSVPGMTTGTYTNSTVTLRDQNNAIIPGFNAVTLAPNGSINLSGISKTAVTSIRATVTVNGVNDPTGVINGQIKITWNGMPPETCFQTTAPPITCDTAARTLTNTANAVTTSPGGTDAPGGNTTGPVSFTESPSASMCGLTIEKRASTASARPGDTVTYTVTVRNTGSQAYQNARIADDLTDVLKDATFNGDQAASTGSVSYSAPTLSWQGPLAAGATATITYSVTVGNPPTADKSMTNTVVSSSPYTNCGPGSGAAACEATVPVSGLVLTKTADQSAVSSPAVVGDTVTYHFTAQNTGQTTLTGVTIADPLPGLSVLSYQWPGVPGTLLAGQTVTATATKALTQTDLDAGRVTNNAVATGNPPTGPPVTSPPASVEVPLTQGPGLALTKIADASGVAAPARVGDVVGYTLTATNTGNVTLTGVTIHDPLPGLSGLTYQWPGVAGVLQPGQSVVATGTYRLTQADIDAGHVANTATAQGTPPAGGSVTPPPAGTDTPLPQGPGLSLVKTADASQISMPARAGQTVTYTFVSTNTGNVTLTDVTIADPMPGLSALTFHWPGPAGTLQPGQSVTASATYRVTQADIDAGHVPNAATTTGRSPDGGTVTPPPSGTDTPLVAGPGLSLVKTADVSAVRNPAAVGDTITYHFTIANTGNVTLTGVSVADQLAGLSAITYTWPGAPGILRPGQLATAVATYQVTQGDIDAGQVVNRATASGNPPGGGSVTTPPQSVPVPLIGTAGLAFVKTADASSVSTPAAVGDAIAYRFTATNTGNVTLTGVVITDLLPGLSQIVYTWPGAPGTLLPGQAVTATATYAVSQPDIDAGHVANTALSRGTPPTGPDATPPPSVTDTPLVANPAMTLVKTADASALNSPTRAGDQITYHFTASNTGNVILTDVSIADALPGLTGIVYAWPGTPGTLAPGQQVTATATYTVTVADIGAGHVENTATAGGTPPAGGAVTTPPATTDTPLTPAPALTLTKTADASGVSNPAAVGQVVAFTFRATNSGNVTLTGVTIDDPLPGLSALTYSWPGAPGTLQPGEFVTATAHYQLTTSDIDRGRLSNVATASGRPPSGPVVDAPPASTDTPLGTSADIALVKSASTSGGLSLTLGDTVTYTFVATNTGNVTLIDPRVSEVSFSGSGAMSPIACPPTPALQPGEQMTCTATYVITQADVDAGVLTNVATATGTPPTGPDVVSPPSQTVLPASQTPGLTLVKSADAAQFSTPARPGDPILYRFVATNTGNVTLTGVQIADQLPGLSAITYSWPTGNAAGTLLPGQHVVGTATYLLTPADIAAGNVHNVATSTGAPPTGVDVVTPPATTDTPIPAAPAIHLVKTADAAAVGSPAAMGDTVQYTFTATNTGNVRLENVSIADPLPGLSALTYTWPGPAGILDPGQAVTAIATYRLTQSDIDAGTVRNTATAAGTTVDGTGVSDTAAATVPLTAVPRIHLVKTADTSGVSAPARAGDILTYTFTATNSGTVTLTGVRIADPHPGLSALVYTWPGAPGVLAPGQSVSATATYRLTQADVNTGHVANTATATGAPPTGPEVTDASSVDVPLTSAAGISLVKTADASGIPSRATPGDPIVYHFAATNTGSVTLTGVTIADPLPGLSMMTYTWPGVAGVLQPGQTVTATASYRLTQADIDAGHVANTATTTGAPPAGPDVTDAATADVPISPQPAIVLLKTADASQVQSPSAVGDQVTYRFTAINAGNVTLTGVTITDPLPGLSALDYQWPGAPGTLSPGAAVTATATYRLTQADLDAGHVGNTATTQGSGPSGQQVSDQASADVPVTSAASIVLQKSADASAVGVPARAGDLVTYTFVATNTGNVSLTGVTIVDPLPGLSALSYTWPGAQGTLKPGESVRATATYRLTQADVDAGHVPNTATTSGRPPSGPDVSATASEDVTVQGAPAITLLKAADASAVGSPSRPGDEVTYRFTATNTGTVTLTGVSISDPLSGLSALAYQWPGAAGVLQPGEAVVATATYRLTQVDIDAGHLPNTAVVVGTPPVGANVTDTSSADVPLPSAPAIVLVKTADASAVGVPARAGDAVTYSFRATNTGNVALTGVSISDPLPGLSPLSYAWPGRAGVLQPGESVTATATYRLTQGDVDAGHVPNTAATVGTPPTGADVTDTSSADVPLQGVPVIALTKAADTSALASPAVPGDTIAYTFTATNTGNVTLSGVTITDPLPGLSPLGYTWPGAPGVLLPGQSVTATADYQLTQADIDAGLVANTASTVGTPPVGPAVTDQDSADVPIAADPGLTLVKVADSLQVGTPARAGEPIHYLFTATNTGNVTLTGVHVDDPLPGLSNLTYTWPGAPGVLLPGQQVNVQATYATTSADIAAGHVANTAIAQGTPPTGAGVTSPPSGTDTPLIAQALIFLVKTADASGVHAPAAVGDTVRYTFTSANTGSLPLSAVEITDPLPGLSPLVYTWPGTPGILLPGEEVTATATYQLTQADLDAGQVVNVASTVGTPPSGPDVTSDSSAVVPLSVPSIRLVKTADASAVGSPAAVGNPVRYTFTATNTGNVVLDGVTIADPLPGLPPLVYAWPGASGTLLPGESVTATTTYRVTQADIDAGSIANTATVTGTPPTGPDVTDRSSVDVPLVTSPGIDLVKVADASGVQPTPRVGDTVTYTFTVTNSGTVTLSSVAVDDPLPGLSALAYVWPGAPGVLRPGQSATATATYRLTQADLDSGSLDNTATATGAPPSGPDVTDRSSAAVPLGSASAIRLVKTADASAVGSPAVVGDIVTYSFAATNTGSVALTNVSISDPLPGLSALTYLWPGTPGTLLPGETVTATATYSVTSADIAAGHVANTATTAGTAPNGAVITDRASADVAVTGALGLTLSKSIETATVPATPKAGDEVTYTFTVTNTGATTLTGVAVTDPMPGLSPFTYAWPGAPGVLAPGQSVTATAGYRLTQADIDAGHVANAATATGTPHGGGPVTTPEERTDTPLTQAPALALTKTADASAVGAPAAPGDTVTYTITATNTGNVTMVDVSITDPMPGLSPLTYAWPGAPGVLAPGQSVVATASYQLTPNDIAAGHVQNAAVAGGRGPDGALVPSTAAGVDVPLPVAALPVVSG